MRCIGTQGITDSDKKMEAYTRVDTICEAWEKEATTSGLVPADGGGGSSGTASKDKDSYDASWGKQFSTLLWRELILRSRSEQLFKAYVGRTIMVRVYRCAVLFRTCRSQPDVGGLISHIMPWYSISCYLSPCSVCVSVCVLCRSDDDDLRSAILPA
jgi:hypothetical protein